MTATALALGLALGVLSAPTQEAPRLSCEACETLLVAAAVAPVSGAEQELVRRIEELTLRTRNMDVDWPVMSILAAYTGYVLSPFLLIGVPLLIVGLTSTAEFAGMLVTIGAVTTGLAGVGVVLLVVGLVTGTSASNAAKEERSRLIDERIRLENQLKELRQSRAPVAWLPVVTVEF